MHELELSGCTSEPMICYLKALGLLRLVAEQKDPSARGFWRGNTFHLLSTLNEEDLVEFFLNDYRPTPILAPWNGGSGFYSSDNKTGIDATRKSNAPRLRAYRQTLSLVDKVLKNLGLSKKPIGEKKEEILRACRAELYDEVLPWLDAAYVFSSDKAIYAPILGTGGNDGRLEFTNNFMQRLKDVLPLTESEQPPSNSKGWLISALFSCSGPPLLEDVAIGQFHPGGVGGPNATQGFRAYSLVNPWDYVLMIEGALFFAGAMARRHGALSEGKASFPFTVQPSDVGYGTAAGVEGGGSSGRAEIWLPLWGRPAKKDEIAHLFAEGRAQLGRRQAATGVEFARAVASLGVDPGIAAFQRFGFLQRSGKTYLAAPLGRLDVLARPEAYLLEEVDNWLRKVRKACRRKGTPSRYLRALRAIDRSIFEFCSCGGRQRLQDVLVSLGKTERELATGRFREQNRLRPLHDLSMSWLEACDDGSTEFRLAEALASIHDREGKIGPIRKQMEPVEQDRTGRFKWSEGDKAVAWGGGSVLHNMTAILERRCLKARSENLKRLPLSGFIHAPLEHVHQFIEGQVNYSRLEDLLWGLCTLNWGGDIYRYKVERPSTFSRAYALLKLLFMPYPLEWNKVEVPIKPEEKILLLLHRGDLSDACEVAGRRLRASGLIPLTAVFANPPLHVAERLAAALLFPVGKAAMNYFAKLTLRPPTIGVEL